MDYRNGLPKWTAKWTTEMDYPKLPTLKNKKITKASVKLGCFDRSPPSFLGRYVMYGDTLCTDSRPSLAINSPLH